MSQDKTNITPLEAGLQKTYVFARLGANSPLSGNTELLQVAAECPGLEHPERISSNSLRKYIATVSQVCRPIL